ncbi:MAG TPA: DnaA N-terminal domain-containing protein, partial [Candidatus Acidoferrales bacterium]|nr:DnaA N-terminal domain-containing protein [Candidatus Acidoferrales bacterium]
MALAIGNSDISNELWQSALNTLEQNFSKPVFEMWIKPMRFVEYREDELHLAVHSKFAREWVGTKLQGQIIEVLREIFGSELELKLSVAEPGEPPTTMQVPSTPRPPEDLRSANLNVRYT